MRIANALGEIGPSVMLGAATTFLGIMPMAFANNEIFRVFFKMFLVIITFGVSVDSGGWRRLFAIARVHPLLLVCLTTGLLLAGTRVCEHKSSSLVSSGGQH